VGQPQQFRRSLNRFAGIAAVLILTEQIKRIYRLAGVVTAKRVAGVVYKATILAREQYDAR
jgi:hypothetical protein